jgi:anti-sigma-K factor RskA
MILKKRDRKREERLDRIGRRVLRASAANEHEAEAAASSPFLYARLRSRIDAERKRREEGERWFAVLGVVWRAVPAMALVAAFAFALFLSVSRSTQARGSSIDEMLLGTRDASVEHVVFADRQPLSSDEVLATIMSGEEREVQR